MLTDTQKTAVRRHCGYPMYGNIAAPAFGYRFFTWYGTLEYRINNPTPEEEIVLISFVDELNTLELALSSASDNLDTNKAAVWEHNPNEVGDRRRLYNMRRRDLCTFIGVPPGPGLGCAGGIVI
jgi:hypothetical protein